MSTAEAEKGVHWQTFSHALQKPKVNQQQLLLKLGSHP
jgi:hypothetical protein